MPADYDSLVKKGVSDSILSRDEDGFFSEVITIHPCAEVSREIVISDNAKIYEYALPKKSRLKIVTYVKYILHIIKVVLDARILVQKEKIDIIRGQDPLVCGLISWVVARTTGIPCCISLHADYDKLHELDPVNGAVNIFGSRRITRLFEKFILSRSDLVLAITEYIACYAQRLGVPRKKIRIFRHRINLENFIKPAEKPEKFQNFPDDRQIISTVGRLSAQKFVFDVIELARILKLRREDFLIIMAGSGDKKKELVNAIDKLNLKNEIILTGSLSRSEVAYLRKISTVNICLLDGASLIEACASGRPVVAYDIEWHKEILRDQITGYIVPVGDVDGLANAVNTLLNDKQKAEKMGKACQDRINALYDPAKLNGDHISIYKELRGKACA